MSPWALADMIGLPSLNSERAVRKRLESATSGAYRAEHPEEFEQIVRWRLEDRYVPAANAAALAEAIPGAKLRVLDNAGHLVFIERYADVNREVVTFLKPRRSREDRGTPGESAGPLRRAARRLVEGAKTRLS